MLVIQFHAWFIWKKVYHTIPIYEKCMIKFLFTNFFQKLFKKNFEQGYIKLNRFSIKWQHISNQNHNFLSRKLLVIQIPIMKIVLYPYHYEANCSWIPETSLY